MTMGKQAPSTNFFGELKEWSERKHRILLMFLAPAAKILGSRYRVIYLDGFAGRGTYGDGDTATKGSPVKAAELAEQYAQEGKSYAFNCINIEKDPDHFDNLEAATKRFGSRVLNLKGTLSQNIDRVLTEVGQCAVICFLDPFGVKGMDWACVERLIEGGKPIDFWMRFDPFTVFRLDGFYDATDKAGQTKYRTLQGVYGIEDKDRLHEYLSGSTTDERVKKARGLYEKKLVDAFANNMGKGYGADYSIYTQDGQYKYDMIFATSSAKGAALASDVIYKVEEGFQHAVAEYKANKRDTLPYQQLLFSTEPPEPTEKEIDDEIVARLKPDILRYCKGKTLSRLSVRAETLVWRRWFGKAAAPHYTKALKQIEQEGGIASVSGTLGTEDCIIKFN
jgi:three-Cys-motif partner protein